MKKTGIIIICMAMLIFCVSGCGGLKSFYGTYKFDGLTYMSPLSSFSADYYAGLMEGSEYVIEAELFKIDSKKISFEVVSPRYVKEGLPEDASEWGDPKVLIGEEIKAQYTILDKDKNKTHWRLYLSSEGVWLASYVDNTEGGAGLITYIYKLAR